MYDFIDFCKECLLPFVLFCVVVFGAIALGANFIVAYQCNNFEKASGFETDYYHFDACYVNYNDRWYRWDEYKARAAASEGLGSISEALKTE